MNIIIRKAKYEDIEGIIKLCDECFIEKTNIDYAKKIFEETINDNNQIYLVGIINNEVVAHLKITIIPTIYEKMNTYAILNHICVKEEYRRKKIATKLLKECEKICKENKCVSMKLWSLNFRVGAHNYYKSNGFEKEDATFFTKNLKGEK